jgi:CDP-diacylglycerol--serine O-phosphatidyltransferase
VSAFPTRLLVRRVAITDHDHIAVEKQKKLLHEATGHFTLIRMLHLADLITELNGS